MNNIDRAQHQDKHPINIQFAQLNKHSSSNSYPNPLSTSLKIFSKTLWTPFPISLTNFLNISFKFLFNTLSKTLSKFISKLFQILLKTFTKTFIEIRIKLLSKLLLKPSWKHFQHFCRTLPKLLPKTFLQILFKTLVSPFSIPSKILKLFPLILSTLLKILFLNHFPTLKKLLFKILSYSCKSSPKFLQNSYTIISSNSFKTFVKYFLKFF